MRRTEWIFLAAAFALWTLFVAWRALSAEPDFRAQCILEDAKRFKVDKTDASVERVTSDSIASVMRTVMPDGPVTVMSQPYGRYQVSVTAAAPEVAMDRMNKTVENLRRLRQEEQQEYIADATTQYAALSEEVRRLGLDRPFQADAQPYAWEDPDARFPPAWALAHGERQVHAAWVLAGLKILSEGGYYRPVRVIHMDQEAVREKPRHLVFLLYWVVGSLCLAGGAAVWATGRSAPVRRMLGGGREAGGGSMAGSGEQGEEDAAR